MLAHSYSFRVLENCSIPSKFHRRNCDTLSILYESTNTRKQYLMTLLTVTIKQDFWEIQIPAAATLRTDLN